MHLGGLCRYLFLSLVGNKDDVARKQHVRIRALLAQLRVPRIVIDGPVVEKPVLRGDPCQAFALLNAVVWHNPSKHLPAHYEPIHDRLPVVLAGWRGVYHLCLCFHSGKGLASRRFCASRPSADSGIMTPLTTNRSRGTI